MKWLIYFLLLVGVLKAVTFECKAKGESVIVEARNLKDAKLRAFTDLNRVNNKIKLEDINCTIKKLKKFNKAQQNSDSLKMESISLGVSPAPQMLIKRKSKMSFGYREDLSGEEYSSFSDNSFKEPTTSPLSTFSVDVDTASYGIVRRYIMQNSSFPPKGAIRIEEMINYFDYDYPSPKEESFNILAKVGESIWNKNHKILQIGVQAKKIDSSKLPPSNLVFLIDVSGSMGAPNKLPLLKRAFKLLVNQLRATDTVSIVVYAGSSGVVLNGVRGDKKSKILKALENLRAGGSTAGGAGINLAYKIAKENFIKGGNNRVILATDGDFNVGVRSESQLIDLIEKEKNSGIYLTVLGFGMGNFKDSKMEKLADKGNGNYGYIDNLLEAKKLLVEQMSGTLFTVAKDVKVQVEFNPLMVKKYRLIGYVNRKMANEDFKNDKKDAGDVGAGHSVTVLYELELKDKNSSTTSPLKYQTLTPSKEAKSDEIATLKLRFKAPDSNSSKEIKKVIKTDSSEIKDKDFYFAQAVAGFGMILRDSEYKGDLTIEKVLKIAKENRGEDKNGYRAEFIRVLEKAQLLKQTK